MQTKRLNDFVCVYFIRLFSVLTIKLQIVLCCFRIPVYTNWILQWLYVQFQFVYIVYADLTGKKVNVSVYLQNPELIIKTVCSKLSLNEFKISCKIYFE